MKGFIMEEKIIEIFRKIDNCIDANEYTYNYVYDDENGKHFGSDTTITSDGLLALRYLIDELYDEIKGEE
jgi:hypothetical protein